MIGACVESGNINILDYRGEPPVVMGSFSTCDRCMCRIWKYKHAIQKCVCIGLNEASIFSPEIKTFKSVVVMFTYCVKAIWNRYNKAAKSMKPN